MNRFRELLDGRPSVALNALKLLGVVLVTLAGIFLAGKAVTLLLPFLIAIMIAAMLDRPVGFLKRRLRINRAVSASLFVVLVTVLIGGLLTVLLVRLYVEAKDLIIQLPGMYNNFVAFIEDVFEKIDTEYEWVTPAVLEEFEGVFARLREAILSLVNKVTRGVWNTAISMPQAFIAFIVMLFTTYFLLRDRERICEWGEKQIPETWKKNINKTRIDLFHSLFAYIRAIIILALITFVELTIGLSVLRVNYAIVIAFLCAVFDALPVIGAGWVLGPWSLMAFLNRDYKMGVGLLLIYGVAWVVRQILEPRIVGGQLGMYPPIFLLAMYLGMQIYGVAGMLIAPLAAIVMRNFLVLYFNGRSFRQVLFAGLEPEEPAPLPPKPKYEQKPKRGRKNV